MKAGAGLSLILACASLLLIGCGGAVRRGTVLPATAPAAPYAAPVQHTQPVQQGQPTTVAVPSSSADGRGTTEETPTVVAPAAGDAAASRQPTPQASAELSDFVVTQELYDKTFREVEDVVEALNRIIAARDYPKWLTNLTAEYIQVTSSPGFLADASKSPVLSQKGIVLRTLEDYFDDVVVRSRTRVRLDSVCFIDARHVKALTRMGQSVVILYYLVREDSAWKVGMWQDASN